MKVVINRTSRKKMQTLGYLSVLDKNNMPLFECYTLELPWLDNQPRISCIPSGKYQVVKRWSKTHGHHFWIQNVPNRSMILIHSGNYVSDTKGCLLVGTSLKFLDFDLLLDLANSRVALEKLDDVLPISFELEILQ